MKTVLGKSYAAYCALLGLYDRHQMQYEWRYYNDARAWLCKVQKKKKTIVWMSARKGYMLATVYFPERLIEQIYTLPIDKETKERVKKTEYVGKSKPCIFEIRDHHILKDMDTVIQFEFKDK